MSNEPEISVKHERELRYLWETAHVHVHALEKEARTLALNNIDRRLSEHNKFREQQMQERADFVPRKEHDLLVDRIGKLEVKDGIQSGKAAAYASIAGAAGVIAAIIGHFWK